MDRTRCNKTKLGAQSNDDTEPYSFIMPSGSIDSAEFIEIPLMDDNYGKGTGVDDDEDDLPTFISSCESVSDSSICDNDSEDGNICGMDEEYCNHPEMQRLVRPTGKARNLATRSSPRDGGSLSDIKRFLDRDTPLAGRSSSTGNRNDDSWFSFIFDFLEIDENAEPLAYPKPMPFPKITYV